MAQNTSNNSMFLKTYYHVLNHLALSSERESCSVTIHADSIVEEVKKGHKCA